METKPDLDMIELKSTFRGLTGAIIARFAWIIGLFVFYRVALNWAYEIMAKYGVFTFWGYHKYQGRTSTDNDFAIFFLGLFGSIAMAAAILTFCNLIGTLYRGREVNQIYLKDGRVICTAYLFPFEKVVREIHFNRITQADVYRNNFDRLLGTGTLHLELITYTNADSRRKSWVIPYIVDPESARETIMSAMPDYTGLSVKVT